MSRHVITLVLSIAVAGVGGFLLGTRTRPRPGQPVLPASVVAVGATPEAMPANVTNPSVPGDYQALKNQLAICMAFHPSSDMQDKMLAMCRGDLAACRDRPTLPDCYNFIDFAPIYDRELGEADPSPETLERAKRLTVEDCVQVTTWAQRAMTQLSSCLKGDTPPGFKERYGRSIKERPFFKSCGTDTLRRDVFNAWFRREEDRVREMGHDVHHRVRMGSDGGILFGPTSSIPDHDDLDGGGEPR
jgi:hypothetical protein